MELPFPELLKSFGGKGALPLLEAGASGVQPLV